VRLWDLDFGSYWATLTGHADGVTALAYSPDGELLLTAGQDWRVRLWNAVSAREVAGFAPRGEGHTQPVRAAAFAPNGWTAASAGGDEAVRVWDVSARRELCAFAGQSGAVLAVAYSPDGRWLASAGADGAVRRRRAPEAERPAPPRRPGRAKPRATSALKAALWCLGAVGGLTLVLFLLARFRGTSRFPGDGGQGWGGNGAAVLVPLQELEGHTDGVAAVAVNEDGSRALSGSFDQSVRLWDLNTGQELRRFDGHSDAVLAVALSPDGRRALSGGLDKTVRLWDVQTGQELRRLDGFVGGVTCLAFSPDGKRFATGGGFKKVIYTDKQGPGQEGASMKWDRPDWPGDCSVVVWETDTGKKLATLSGQGVGHRDEVTCLAFTPAGDRLVSGSFDKFVSLWDLKTGKEIRRFHGHKGEVFGVAVSADGKRLLSCSGQLGREKKEKKKGGKEGDKEPEPAPPEPEKQPEQDNTVRLWDLETGKLLRTFTGHHNAVFAVAISPDGQRALSGSFDASVRLWDVESGKELVSNFDHRAAVTCVAFTPDGQQAVSGGWDKKLRVWKLP
jgi:WD40 repeat protein